MHKKALLLPDAASELVIEFEVYLTCERTGVQGWYTYEWSGQTGDISVSAMNSIGAAYIFFISKEPNWWAYKVSIDGGPEVACGSISGNDEEAVNWLSYRDKTYKIKAWMRRGSSVS